MFPVRRSGDQGQNQGLARRGSEVDLFSPSSLLSASPWQIMRRMQEDMDRLFGSFLGGGVPGQAAGGQAALAASTPNVDISEDEKEFCLEMDLPGFRPEDVDIQVQNGQLLVRAETRQESEQAPQGQGDQQQQGQQPQRQYHRRERRYGVVQQVLSLPENVDEENIQAEFNHGVLSVHLPKQPQLPAQGRRIPIAGAAQTGQGQQSTGGQPAPQQSAPEAQPEITAGAGTGERNAQAG